MLSPSRTLAVSFTPSGVSSNAQAKTSAIGKPRRSAATIAPSNQPGRPSEDSRRAAACATSQPTTA